MKIGIISDGNDTLALFKMLTKYNHEYLIYHDQTHFPFGTKDVEFIVTKIKKGIGFLKEQGAEKILLDPIYELLLLQDEEVKNDIFPLFESYLKEYAFKFSLVGKIWILTDFASKDMVQGLVEKIANDYELTDHQKAIKRFYFPFKYRVKSAANRTAGIADLGVHNPYLIRTLKNDLRYFKDAYVDTVLPMHYQYFKMQRTIKAFFNFNTIRFHDLSVIDECFKTLTEGRESHYAVQIRTNQDKRFLLKEKELVWLLQRGKEFELEIRPQV